MKLPALQHKNPMVLLHDQQRRFINLCAALVLLLTYSDFPFNFDFTFHFLGIDQHSFNCNQFFFVFLFRNREPFPVAKNVPIDRLLAMISRLSALNSKSLSKMALANFGTWFSKAYFIVRPRNLEISRPLWTEQLTLASIIPDLQSSVLDVLKSLVAVCRSQLLTRATTVMNLFVQVLQWTSTKLDRRRVGVERPYG